MVKYNTKYLPFSLILLVFLSSFTSEKPRLISKEMPSEKNEQNPSQSKWVKEKINSVNDVLDVTTTLSKWAAVNVNYFENNKLAELQPIYNEIDKLKSPKQILMLGRICQAILAKEDASHVSYDKVFSIAFLHCIDVLVQDTSDEATDALQTLADTSNTNAGETIIFKEAIARQLKEKRSKK